MSTPNSTVPDKAGPAEKANPTDAIEPHILAKLDPDFVKYWVEVVSKNPPAAQSIDQIRAHPEKFRNAIAVDTTGWERVTDHAVTSEDGAEIPVRAYYPDPAVHGDGPYAVHLNFHGGGFVLGDLMSEAQLCLSMRDGAGVVVIDVNYRHCPETVWGKCVQDGWAVLCWARESATTLNLNPASVSIGGVSAGAHISLILQHLARDAGIPLKLCMATVPPAAEGFFYKFYTESPFPSFHEFYRSPILPWARIQWFGKLSMPPDKHEELQAMWPDWWFSPLKARNWTGLCDTYIRTAECDLLRDEGEAYGMKLVAGGNKVTFKRYLGAPHTFMHLPCMRKKHVFDEDSISALQAAHGLS
ncbi:alpha/beta-hydrolase [Coniochaeta ligniaria NRRL 30616]|uniref:Alpha/beta-hydrolase n=1 Tax=Coniochaeta ligniaria NRRL 30616 TaxID=1408157 RepID=A0A1J7IZ01_9PEZI|nr:alpha/beta-hydrolase [Coniochaeta ligniaria NRRL 30616]